VIQVAIDTGILTNVAYFASFSIVYAVLAIGFNIQWGYTGLFNAGIAGFFLIGAYTAAIVTTPYDPPTVLSGVVIVPGHWGGLSWPFVIGAILAMVFSGLAAALIAIPTLRLRADYLAIATLAFAEIIRRVAINFDTFTGGTNGITRIPQLVTFVPSDPFAGGMVLLGAGAFVLLAVLLLMNFTVESPWGRILRAIREDEVATMALGKNTLLAKIQAFALGGALMGLAGALFIITKSYLNPDDFAPALATFPIWVMVIVGGAGNNRGAILGAFLLYGMEYVSVLLKDFVASDKIFYIRLMIIGALLILLIMYRPQGLLPERRRVLQ
jgi:branched-chain amino acid transport system permease protein